jgi:tripartite-type tricarboxylate transporter receptor subunit TctC
MACLSPDWPLHSAAFFKRSRFRSSRIAACAGAPPHALIDIVGRRARGLSFVCPASRPCAAREDEIMRVTQVFAAQAFAALVGALLTLSVGHAQAQEKFPSKPIRVLVPYVPGGATDYAARLVTEKAKLALGQNIIIENKAGAGGIVAMEEMARSKPDGYTLMIGNVTTNAITPIIFKKRMSIDYEREVMPVARLLVTPSVFVVNSATPARTFPEFVAHAKKNPGKLRYSSTGIGSFVHYDMEVMSKRLGLDMIHIPYKGGAGEAIKGLVSGDVNVGTTNSVLGISLSQSGKIFLLATNMHHRLKQLPDVPTFDELGLKGQGTLNWSALFAPAGTPGEIVETLHRAFTDAVKDPLIMEQAEKTGTFGFAADTVDETSAWLKDEMEKWRRTTAEIKIEMN